MEKTINKVNSVEYEFVVTAGSEELEERVNRALKAQRSQVNMKGFRPGKVPLSLVRKIYGKAVGFEVAEKFVTEVFSEEVEKSDEYDVYGHPQLTELAFEPGSDFKAVIRFGVKPEVELQDVSDEEVVKLDHAVTDEEVEREFSNMLREKAEYVKVDEAAGEDSYVLIDLQRIDEESGTPIIGEKQEGALVNLGDETLLPALKEKLIGREEGDVFNVDLPAKTRGTEEEIAASGTNRFRVTVKEVQREELPELTEERVSELTDGKAGSEEELREMLRDDIVRYWRKKSRELLEQEIVDRMVELHPLDIPPAAVEAHIDSFVEDVKRRNEGNLPAGFNMEEFRQRVRPEAEKLARWVLIKEAIAKKHGLEVSEDDLDDYFSLMSENAELSADDFKRFYQRMPDLSSQLNYRLLSDKIFEQLIDEFKVRELDEESFVAYMKDRDSARKAAEPQV